MQDDLGLIKEEIYNLGLVPKLLEAMDCDINSNTSSSERIEASRPNGDNNRSVQVYLNEYLSSRVRSKAHIPIKDIYDLVSYIVYGKETSEDLRRNIPKSKRYIIDTLGLHQFNNRRSNVPKDDPNAWLKRIQRKRKKRISLEEIEPNKTFPESILDGFVMKPHIEWVKDGIPTDIQKDFDVGYDMFSERIIFPIRNRDGEIVGIKGRATRKDDEEDFKYMSLLNFQKSKELFNLHRALPFILDKKEVIVAESEKSVMKLYSMDYKNCVSQMGSEISRVQAEILKRICPDIKVTLVYDKDKSATEIKQFARVFGNYKNIYGVVDIKDYLDDKDSPADASKEVWEELYNNHCYKIFPK